MPGRQSKHNDTSGDAELIHTLRAAAQQIWLAGLGALMRTQEEGGKVLGALKNEGRRTGRTAAQATRGASATIDRLEQLFESGIGRTLQRLGVPTAKDMRVIHERLDALEGRSTARKTSASTRRPARVGAAAKKHTGTTARTKATAKTAAGTAAKKRASSRPRAAA